MDASSEWNSIYDFPTFPKKRTTSRGIPKFSRKFSFHSTLLPEFLKFSVEWFAFRKFNSFRNFWKLFQEISVPFAAVSKFSKVLVEWKAPQFSLSSFRFFALPLFAAKETSSDPARR